MMSDPLPLCAICGGPCAGGRTRLALDATHPLYWEHLARYAPAFDHYEYWRQREDRPAVPHDPRWWCAVHARPLTWDETHRPERPQCSWCNPYPAPLPPSPRRHRKALLGADE